MPVRHPHAHPARGAPCHQLDKYGRCVLGDPRERTMSAPVVLDRRRMLAGGGALIVSFSLASAFAQDQGAPAAAPAPGLPGSLKKAPFLDSWVRIDADGSITVFTGKAELGQGFKTAFQQIAAEELDVRFESLKVITVDTHLTANEEYTAGSHSVQDSGTAIQNAAAQARELLLAAAARRYPGQSHRWRCLCSGPAAARHGACEGGAAAELWRPIDGLRHVSGRENAGCRQGGS